MNDSCRKRAISDGIAAIRKRWPTAASDSAESPIFVLAAGWRSGSTLIQRLLMPHCFVWGEPYGHAWMMDSLADTLRAVTDDWPEPHFLFQGQDIGTLTRSFIANLYPPIDCLIRAHLAYFDAAFAKPARAAGAERWGTKEVRLTADHAAYLKWLYPRSKCLMIYRNPYDAFRSYAARRDAGWKWYNRWPDRPLTTREFARHWRTLTAGFLEHGRDSDALVVRYEDLARGEFTPVESYLGLTLSREIAKIRPNDGPSPLMEIPAGELRELQAEVGELAASLGYHYQAGAVAGVPLAACPPVSGPHGQQAARGTQALAGEVEGKGTDGDSHIWPRAEAHATETRGNGPSTDNSKCAILVPVGSHVEPACEEALRELERRGYAVRRVRGFSAIDQGRNQMATDALAAGFEETMWIDSDIGFDPAAVDRLRSHPLPIVCAIYPKKGKRELACHVMPGTRQIVFGQGGGLIEILYAGTGFLLVRREVYAEMRRQLQLPSCNDAWGTPMLPFFQPMVKPHGEGYWYLAEDFAFSQRARQCGYKIMADTTIRLSHFGGFAYSWEQAGMDPPKYATFNFHLSGMDADAAPPKPEDPTPKAEDPSKTAVEATTNHTKKAKTESGVDVHQTVEAAAAPVGRSDGLEKLAAQHPWPSLPPQTPANKEHGWLLDSTREMLAASLSAQPRVIVELGSWLGLSTRFIADCAPCGTVIAIDHWKGGPDHQDREEYRAMLPHLYETFLASCWEYRGRIIPVRASTIEGLREVAGYGVRPDLIYLDADHTYDAVKRDLEEALALFPSARIVGDDWTWQSVREAVTAVCAERGLTVIGSGNAWQIER